MKKYNPNTLDTFAEVMDELPLWSAPFGLKLLECVNYKTGMSAIDIGFGYGFPLTELAARLGESSVVYGIDPSKESIVRTNQKIAHYGLTNIRIIEGVAESIPLADESVELIVSNNGLNNVEDMDKVLSECSRILKPGGQFVLTMNTDKTMFEFYGILEEVLSELHMHKEIELMHQHIHHKRRPIDEVVQLLHKHGFTVNEIDQEQFCYKFANGTAMLDHYFIRMAFIDSWVKLLPADMVDPIFAQIEARMNAHAETFGGIRMTIPFAVINVVKG